jgi:amidase
MTAELWRMGAMELAAAIRGGTVTATEVIESHLQRITTVNPTVNAITETLESSALMAAREVDRQKTAGEQLGVLAGIPFTVKGSIDVAVSATTFGISVLKNALPAGDAPMVRRLRNAGAIPIGRTNLPDLSMRFHTSSQLYGETRNPWSQDCSPGGSSGGEGVALATGMCALGLGSDAGGSVRIPALFGGVSALKPSYGRFPSDRSIGPRDLTLASQWIPVEGVLARKIADLQCAFEVLAGVDACHPRVVPAPSEGPPLTRPMRVAVVPDPGSQGVHPSVRRAVERAADILQRTGYEPELSEMPRLDEAIETHGKLIMTEFQLAWPTLQRLLAPDARRYIEFSMAACPPADLAEYVRLTSAYQRIRRDWSQFLETFPLILAPVFTEVSVPSGYDIAGREEHEHVGRAMRMCAASSLVGVPAVCVPVGVDEGLPLGVQLIGPFYREDICFEAASIIERNTDALCPIDPRELKQRKPEHSAVAIASTVKGTMHREPDCFAE